MRDAAREDMDWVSIHRKSTIYDEWDADMLYGCVCDAGFQGWDWFQAQQLVQEACAWLRAWSRSRSRIDDQESDIP